MTIDATDWKARCEAAERVLDLIDNQRYAAQDENEKLRARCEAAEESKRKQAEDIVKLGRMLGMEVMRAELMERERTSAQDENEKLRAALLRCSQEKP